MPHFSAHAGDTRQPSKLLYSSGDSGEGRTDGRLSARVDERLDGVTIHFSLDVEHVHAPEPVLFRSAVFIIALFRYGRIARLGHVLHRRLEVFEDGLLSDGLLNLALGLNVVRVRVEQLGLVLLLELGRALHRVELGQQLAEPDRVRHGRLCEFGLIL